jgi:uncharacterized protein YndB with AHSA1/START domain
VLRAPVREVWNAITTPQRLGAWFDADVELDPRPDAPVLVRWVDGSTSRGLVETVEPCSRFGFRWRRMSGAGWGLRVGEVTRVEFVLRAVDGDEATEVTVTESRGLVATTGGTPA